MKVLLLAIVVTATALPVLKDDEAVKIILKGLNEGQFPEIDNIVDMTLKENSIVGITATGKARVQPVMLSKPVTPKGALFELVVISHPIAQASLHQPVIRPQAAILDAVSSKPVVLPQSIALEVILPEPMGPLQSEVSKVMPDEVVLSAREDPNVVEPLPVPAAQDREFYNDSGMSENAPEDAGVFNTLQRWFNVFMNYFSGDGTDDQPFNPSEKMW